MANHLAGGRRIDAAQGTGGSIQLLPQPSGNTTLHQGGNEGAHVHYHNYYQESGLNIAQLHLDSASSSHTYPSLHVSQNANAHLGDIHHHYPQQAHSSLPAIIKPFGLCLGQAPLIAPTFFQGRTAELDDMERTLNSSSQISEPRRIVLVGMGGIGKTQLAIAYAQRHQSCYDSVFWLNAASHATLKSSMRSIAQIIMGLQECRDLADEQILNYVHQWLSDVRNTRWLLIFDNYDEPEEFSLETYYPYTSHGSIVVTSRLRDCISGHQIRVQPLEDVDDGLSILKTRSQRENVMSGKT